MARDDGLRVDLYLREGTSPAVTEQQHRVRSRLEGTLATGTLSVREHPRRIPADGDSPLFERLADVRAWASEAGVSLSPFFDRREAYDPAAADVREMVTLPVLWLTLSEGSSVRATYPHVDGEVETVSDAVSELVDGAVPGDAADRANDGSALRPHRFGSNLRFRPSVRDGALTVSAGNFVSNRPFAPPHSLCRCFTPLPADGSD